MSATIAARLIVRFGFRKTARWGALLILAGFAALIAAAWWNASVPWISAACALIGAGLGPSSMSQVLAIQNVVAERQRGVATSLVPFFRTIGGSIGVGAMGGLLAAGLARRLGPAAESAGRLLATGTQSAGSGRRAGGVPGRDRALAPAGLRDPGGLAIVNLFVTERFPTDADLPAEAAAAETELPG